MTSTELTGAALLTRREREVMEFLAEGHSNAEIASALWIAPTTVRKHLENIYAKLGVRTRTAAVARARPRPGTLESTETG
jgi:ATP/maltotriose-dependent transcriptional regulator MalT